MSAIPIVVLAAMAAHCSRDLTREQAAAILRASPPFTTRKNSPVRRELVEVTFVKRVGNHAIEAEFTWKDAPSLPNALEDAPRGPRASKDGAIKKSMALFRDNDGEWKLTSLYKVD